MPQRRGWDKIELYFNGEVSDPVIESLIDVAALRTALNKSHTADLDNTAATLAPSAATLAPEATTNSSRSTRTPSSRSRYGSSGNLTPAQITTMRTTFNNNFSKFNGDPWLLSSGTVFDDCLRGVVEGLSLESALHSFIIEDMDPILHLFENTADQEEIKRVTSRGGSLPELSSAQSSFLMQYNMAPADLEEYLSTHGWRNVGEDKPSDNFRKKDGGVNNTKKLLKLTKDAHDAIREMATRDIREQLVTFGLRLSGPKLTIFTLRQLPGRFYQAVAEDSVSFPEIWIDNDTETIITVIGQILILRKATLELAVSVVTSTSLSLGRGRYGDTIAPTMTSPQFFPTTLVLPSEIIPPLDL
ncbi:hypothetical protein BGX31_002076 [Mortierella sp. GBA43]|nr:hypothetical protein BGX31_002076 [Mortierella sp. GBA43]